MGVRGTALVGVVLLLVTGCAGRHRAVARPAVPPASAAAPVPGGSDPAVGTSAGFGSAPPPISGSPRSAAPGGLGRNRLVFDSDRTGNFEVYAMGTDGTGVTPLTRDSRYDSWWGRISPDRRRVLFYRTPRGVHDLEYEKASLWMMNADGSSVTELRPAGTDRWGLQGHAEWSPDGRQLVMIGGPTSNLQIFVTDPAGRNPRQVTRRGGTNLDPSWSPDGRRIVFVGCPAAFCLPANYEIFTIAADGTDTRRITDDGLRDHDPYYSPDGRRIAWLTQTSTAGAVGVWNIRIAGTDGSARAKVTDDRAVNSKPAWSLDGDLIYFHRLDTAVGPTFGLYSVRPDGTGMTLLSRGQPGSNEYPTN